MFASINKTPVSLADSQGRDSSQNNKTLNSFFNNNNDDRNLEL